MPVAVFLQSTLLYGALPGGANLDLVFLLSLAFALRWGALGGAVSGLWAGALLGAALGDMAVCYSSLYGLIGWMAGLHAELTDKRWTYPLVGFALWVLWTVADSELSNFFWGERRPLGSMVISLGWNTMFMLPLAALKK